MDTHVRDMRKKALVPQLLTPSKSSQEASKQAGQAVLLTCHSTHYLFLFLTSLFHLETPMYDLSILSYYQKQAEMEVTRQSCRCRCVLGESDPREVPGSLGPEISIVRAL